MKKIISILVIAMLLATSLVIALPTSAANTKTLEIDWTKLAYEAYNSNGSLVSESTFLNNFTVSKTKDTFGVSRKTTSGNSVSYISTSKFAITETTDYTYEVMGKNNNNLKYSGIPFAIDSNGVVYFIYGSFNNKNDTSGAPSTIVSYVISAKGDFDKKYPNTTKNETASMYFEKLQLTDGFASFKFEYNGLNVSIYAKDSSGNYTQMGEDVPLPSGSSVAIGLFSRDASNGGNRTTTIKNGKITANNQEAVDNLILAANNGASDLKAEIVSIQENYPEANYTSASYSTLKKAINNANKVVENFDATADEVNEAMEALRTAVSKLKLKKADTSKIEEAIKKAKALKELEWTEISYKMVVSALESAEDLLENEDATQVELDAAADTLMGRINALQPSGITAPEEEEEEETEAVETEPATETEKSKDAILEMKQSCKSAVGSTAVVVALVSTLGTALVIKKRR